MGFVKSLRTAIFGKPAPREPTYNELLLEESNALFLDKGLFSGVKELGDLTLSEIIELYDDSLYFPPRKLTTKERWNRYQPYGISYPCRATENIITCWSSNLCPDEKFDVKIQFLLRQIRYDPLKYYEYTAFLTINDRVSCRC
jgi:hypothetical protein